MDLVLPEINLVFLVSLAKTKENATFSTPTEIEFKMFLLPKTFPPIATCALDCIF